MTIGIREVVIGLNTRGSARREIEMTRRAVSTFAQQLRDPAGTLRLIEGISSLEEALDRLLASHVDPATVAEGQGGTFDACDLRHWLAVAERAGVPVVPAREILTLDSEEVSALMRPIAVPGRILGAIRRRASKILGQFPDPVEPPVVDRASVMERILAAGDLIPPGHVVRSAICGPSTMKALAGTGTLSDAEDSARFGDLRVGCGWVRNGNRTRIDVTDSRMVDLQARGHEDTFRFLVRPWVDAGRRVEGEDPHGAGTPMAGVRSWPAEWRVFIENGAVKGVANYYCWAGEVTPEAARGALAARAAAERILDEMKRIRLLPVFSDLFLMNVTMARTGADAPPAQLAQALAIVERFPADAIHGTLDFIETGDGEVTLLEGGPAHTPIGGAHPTAFVGCLESADNPMLSDIRGVAFRQAEGVHAADPKTWKVQPSAHALAFEEVEGIAFERGPEP